MYDFVDGVGLTRVVAGDIMGRPRELLRRDGLIDYDRIKKLLLLI
jgi:hypothetical protein